MDLLVIAKFVLGVATQNTITCLVAHTAAKGAIRSRRACSIANRASRDIMPTRAACHFVGNVVQGCGILSPINLSVYIAWNVLRE